MMRATAIVGIENLLLQLLLLLVIARQHLGLMRVQPQLAEQLNIFVFLRVRRGQQLAAVEDGVGPGHKAHCLGLLVHLAHGPQKGVHKRSAS